MATREEIDAAKIRWIEKKYARSQKGLLDQYVDMRTLTNEFIEQRSQPVNDALLNAAKSLVEICHTATKNTLVFRQADDSFAFVSNLQDAQEAIAAAEAEIAEREKPVTEDWLLRIGFMKDEYSRLFLYRPARLSIMFWMSGNVTLKVSGNEMLDMPTRGDVLDLIRVLGEKM